MTARNEPAVERESARQGRPRRFDNDVERTMLLDAGIRAMTATGFSATSVNDVLAEAGLSTRSFYRHFDSKDELVAAVVRREAERVNGWLTDAIDSAADPVEALGVWIDRTLDLFFDRRRSSRTALFSTPDVVRSSRIPEELSELRELVFGPLAKVLATGDREGLLSSADPDFDAMTIFELVSVSARDSAVRRRGRAAVRRHIVRFAYPALGLNPAE